MKQNQYYNKRTMNLKQLTRDLNFNEKVGIELSKTKYWKVYFYDNFCRQIRYYEGSTNWSVIKLLNKLLIEA